MHFFFISGPLHQRAEHYFQAASKKRLHRVQVRDGLLQLPLEPETNGRLGPYNRGNLRHHQVCFFILLKLSFLFSPKHSIGLKKPFNY